MAPPLYPLPGWLKRLLEEAGFTVEPLSDTSWRASRPADGKVLLGGPEAERRLRTGPGDPPPSGETLSLLLPRLPRLRERERAATAGFHLLSPETLLADLDLLLVVSPAPEPPVTTLSPVLPPPPEEVFPEAPTPFPPEVFPRERVVRPRISWDDARRYAEDRLRGYRIRPVLVPFYLFAYRIRGLPGDRPGSPHFWLAVPAVPGEVESWSARERELVPQIPGEWRRLPGTRSEGDCRALALSTVLVHHGRVVDRSEWRGGVLVIDRTRGSLGAEEVEMGEGSLVWVPHWLLDGRNGRIILDSVTGLPAQLDPEDGFDG